MILEALWSGRRLKFQYENSDGECSDREVDPLGLVTRGNRWYLIAGTGDERRTYRVSRIRTAAILPERSSRPDGFDLAAHWEASTNWFREHLPRYDATFLATPAIMPWVCYRTSRVLERVREGERFRVSLRFDAPEEAKQFAMAHGAELEVVAPSELKEYVIATAKAMVAAYASTAATTSLAARSGSPVEPATLAPEPALLGH